MKMQAIKQQVYRLTCTSNTKQLKLQRYDLTYGRDLRYKQQWQEILQQLKELRASGQDFSLADLEQSEQMLKDSLFTVGRLSGMSDDALEIEWQRIQLEAQFNAQFGDIHIEQL